MDCNILLTRIGKLSAAYTYTKSIAQNKPAMIINLGSAGSNTFSKREIVYCTEFIQHDMDVRGLGF
jgi:adenosylhomocysteine nucleosidase